MLNKFEITKLVNSGLADNTIGSGQLLAQLNYIDKKYPELNLKLECNIPQKIIPVTGQRQNFIQKSGLNPFYFFTWL